MTNITLEQVAPDFLEKEKIAHSEIWNKTVTIKKGERLQIVAPSGSGKSSLIHFLYGMRKDYHGNILFDGKPVKSFTPEDTAANRSSHLSIIFQDLRLFPEQTAHENIEIKRLLQPYHPQSKVNEMAAALGVSSKLKQLGKTCSYGEQQRIAIIRSLQQPFDFLLLDEPFSHLDENNRKKAMALIEEEATSRGAAIVLADLKPIEYFNSERTLHL